MRFTKYFLYTQERADRKAIKKEWIEYVFKHYIKEEKQQDGRLKRWAYIQEAKKYLRIIVLEDGITIHNAFFDRSFKLKNL